jgi:hypothetical protein
MIAQNLRGSSLFQHNGANGIVAGATEAFAKRQLVFVEFNGVTEGALQLSGTPRVRVLGCNLEQGVRDL